jgi:hypothetical protein
MDGIQQPEPKQIIKQIIKILKSILDISMMIYKLT